MIKDNINTDNIIFEECEVCHDMFDESDIVDGECIECRAATPLPTCLSDVGLSQNDFVWEER